MCWHAGTGAVPAQRSSVPARLAVPARAADRASTPLCQGCAGTAAVPAQLFLCWHRGGSVPHGCACTAYGLRLRPAPLRARARPRARTPLPLLRYPFSLSLFLLIYVYIYFLF